MVRNLMLILGVSLAAAAFGCSDDGNGTGGNGGNGGDGGNGGTEVDACVNEDDLSIVCDEQFDIEVRDCAVAAAGDPEETSQCLQDPPLNVSKDCADCYGETTDCTRENCTLECASEPFSVPCQECRAEHCVPTFDPCRGDLATACAM